jgi:hypothetical protein
LSPAEAKKGGGQLLTKEGKRMTDKGIAIAAGMARAKAAKLAGTVLAVQVKAVTPPCAAGRSKRLGYVHGSKCVHCGLIWCI